MLVWFITGRRGAYIGEVALEVELVDVIGSETLELGVDFVRRGDLLGDSLLRAGGVDVPVRPHGRASDKDGGMREKIESRDRAAVGEALGLEMVARMGRDREEPGASFVFGSNEQIVAIRSPLDRTWGAVPVLRDRANSPLRANGIHEDPLAIRLVVDFLHLEIADLATIRREGRASGVALETVRGTRAIRAVDSERLRGSIMGREVNIRRGVVTLGELGGLGFESDPFSIRGEVVIRRLGVWGVRALEVLDRVHQIVDLPIRAVLVVAVDAWFLQSAGEHGVEGSVEPVVPVTDVDAVIDASGAQTLGGQFFVVGCSIGVGFTIHDVVDVARMCGDSLEAREGCRKGGGFVSRAVSEVHEKQKRTYIPLGEVLRIRHPQLDATRSIGVGAVDVQNGRVVRAQPDNLRDILVLCQGGGLSILQVQQVPRRFGLVGIERVLGS